MTITQALRRGQSTRTLVRFAAIAGLMAVPTLAMAAEPPPAPTVTGNHPLAGRIWEAKTKRMLSPDELVGRVLTGGIVILGETHDNPDHHALQAWMVRRIADAGRRPLTALEMVDADQQAAIDANLGDVAGLGAALNWEKRGWPDWALYRPIVDAAVSAGGGLVGANLPVETTRQIAKGRETTETDARFGLDAPLSPQAAKAMAEEIRDGHCNMLPETAVPAMVRVQRARDAAMAEVVAEHATRPEIGPVILIAGSGHARLDRGVPARLRALVPGIPTFTLAFLELEPEDRAPAILARFNGATPPFDAVWFTAKAPREDQCAQLEKHLKKKKAD
ncbi:MAG: hypothetical protein EPN20_14205 [Magnetospirillum sp.]|nr:MAG: hypothetical protein EPN20_14205 [Magnetospirillum sp.]